MKTISLDLEIYNLDAIKKCFYWYSDRFTFDIKKTKKKLSINISSLSDNDTVTDDIIKEIKSDLIDFEVRNIITKETDTIRQILLAKAFSPTDRYDSEPPGEISDPVGFKP